MALSDQAPNASPRETPKEACKAEAGVSLRRRTALKAMGAAALAGAAPMATGEVQAATSAVRQVKARFQPDAAEVQTFYRVNKY